METVSKKLAAINDLFRHQQSLNSEIMAAFERFLKSGWYVLGQEVSAFEKEFAEYCGVSQALGVANGTDALEIALRALGAGIDDNIALVANAGGYGTIAVNAMGAKPVYVDVDFKTMTMDINSLKKTLATHKIHTVIATHLYGRLADIETIKQLATQHNAKIIEDCAQAHGAMINGTKAGAFGDIACFSFYPTKNLGAIGDGGAILTNDLALASNIKHLRQYGWEKKYSSTKLYGRNSRLDELQAAILRVKLPYLDSWNHRRKKIAALYNSNIKHEQIILPEVEGEDYVAHLYVIRVNHRAALSNHLQRLNIPHDIHYPTPDYKQPMFKDQYVDLTLPTTEQLSHEVMTLPCFPEMTDEEVVSIASAVNQWEP